MKRSLFSAISVCALAVALCIAGVCFFRANAAVVSNAQAQVGSSNADLVFRQAEADSIDFAAGDKHIIVQASPVATVLTSACGGGIRAKFPVQNVFVVDESHTYITDVIVCAQVDLHPGDKLKAVAGPKKSDREGSRMRFELE